MLPPFSITFRVCFLQLLIPALTFLLRNICNHLQTQTNKTSFLPLLPFLCYEVADIRCYAHIVFFRLFCYILSLLFGATDIYPFVFGHCFIFSNIFPVFSKMYFAISLSEYPSKKSSVCSMGLCGNKICNQAFIV